MVVSFLTCLYCCFFNAYELPRIKYQWGPIEIEFANKQTMDKRELKWLQSNQLDADTGQNLGRNY